MAAFPMDRPWLLCVVGSSSEPYAYLQQADGQQMSSKTVWVYHRCSVDACVNASRRSSCCCGQVSHARKQALVKTSACMCSLEMRPCIPKHICSAVYMVPVSTGHAVGVVGEDTPLQRLRVSAAFFAASERTPVDMVSLPC